VLLANCEGFEVALVAYDIELIHESLYIDVVEIPFGVGFDDSIELFGQILY
jgi:hypothetical protein